MGYPRNISLHQPFFSKKGTCQLLWSNSINAFLFGHGPMTPTLMDVFNLTDLNITEDVSPWSLKTSMTHRLVTENIGGLKKYIQAYSQTGAVTDREQTAFLMMWLEHYIVCLIYRSHQQFSKYNRILSRWPQNPLGRIFVGRHVHHAASSIGQDD